MPSPASRAQDIAARLSVAGCKPRLTRHFDHIRIDVDPSDMASLSQAQWHVVVAALELADQVSGHGDPSGATVRASVYTVPRSVGDLQAARHLVTEPMTCIGDPQISDSDQEHQ